MINDFRTTVKSITSLDTDIGGMVQHIRTIVLFEKPDEFKVWTPEDDFQHFQKKSISAQGDQLNTIVVNMESALQVRNR